MTELLQEPVTAGHAPYGLVHIWLWEITREHALCGSRETHRCPESASGSEVAILPFGTARCWCGSALCQECLKRWKEVHQ